MNLIRVLSSCAILVVLAYFAHMFWLQLHMPKRSLEILGNDGGRFEWPIEMGKEVCLHDYLVQNFGQETTGLKVEISGQAFDANLLINPRVLIEFEDKSQIDVPYVAKKIRQIMPLVQMRKNFWVGISKDAFLAHKDDMISEAVQLLLGKSKLSNGAIGWWSDNLGPGVTIYLFADVPKNGKGSLNLKAIPIACPGSAVGVFNRITTTALKSGDEPILSVAVPTDFPVTAYPDSQIIWLSRTGVKLNSAATPTAIAAYYKEELNRKNWKTTVKEDHANRTLIVEGSKGKSYISIEMLEIEQYTPIKIRLHSFKGELWLQGE